jgi:ankyrin repeat protein
MAQGSVLDAEGHWTGPGLFHAIKSQKVSTVKIFLDAGTDANSRDEDRKTPLMSAVSNTKGETIVMMLLDAGVDVHAEDLYSETTLHYGLHESKIGVLKALINSGADVNKGCVWKIFGKTALMYAVVQGLPSAVEVLLEGGAHPDSCSLWSSLHYTTFGVFSILWTHTCLPVIGESMKPQKFHILASCKYWSMLERTLGLLIIANTRC